MWQALLRAYGTAWVVSARLRPGHSGGICKEYIPRQLALVLATTCNRWGEELVLRQNARRHDINFLDLHVFRVKT
jgi:hypothetical protein